MEGGDRPLLFPSLSRQGSIYSLTLNEVQSHLGEPLYNMNLDELLKNVMPAEAGTSLGMSLGGVQHQGVGRGMSTKTVDEVWRDIQRKKKGPSGHERQPTLGEMTLEDFLTKAGVVRERAGKSGNIPVGNVGACSNPAPATQGATPGTHWLQQKTMMGAYMNPKGQVAIPPTLVATMSDTRAPRRKRGGLEVVMEKGGERRQKRMIKNRESAARSRARKQAYINELENKISHLEQENGRLKKQKELEAVLPYIPSPETKYQLRRSSSCPL